MSKREKRQKTTSFVFKMAAEGDDEMARYWAEKAKAWRTTSSVPQSSTPFNPPQISHLPLNPPPMSHLPLNPPSVSHFPLPYADVTPQHHPNMSFLPPFPNYPNPTFHPYPTHDSPFSSHLFHDLNQTGIPESSALASSSLSKTKALFSSS